MDRTTLKRVQTFMIASFAVVDALMFIFTRHAVKWLVLVAFAYMVFRLFQINEEDEK